MEVVNVTVVDTPEVVAVNVAVAFGTVVNRGATYSATVNSGDTLVVPDSIITNSEGAVVKFLEATLPYVLPDSWAHSSDWSIFVKVPSTQSVEFPDTPIKNTLGTTILTQPSGTNTGVIADSVATNSDNTFSLNIPAETNPVLADITVTEPDLSTYTYPAAKDITLPDNRNAYFYFIATYDDYQQITADANTATTWTTETLTNVATIAYEKNSVAASLPITLAVGDTLKVTITRTNAALDSLVKLNN